VSLGVHNLLDTFPDYDKTIDGNPFCGKDHLFEYSDSSPFGLNGGFFLFKNHLQVLSRPQLLIWIGQ
jgi:hypothetical protein